MESETASPAHDGKLTLSPARLKSLRRAWALSQESLAQLCVEQRLSISIASIKRAEAGKAVLYRTARHLAQLYQVELASLLLAPSKPAERDALWRAPVPATALAGQPPAAPEVIPN